MSKIDELKKQNKFLNLSVYDVFTFILPNEKSKYIELLTNILKNENKYDDYLPPHITLYQEDAYRAWDPSEWGYPVIHLYGYFQNYETLKPVLPEFRETLLKNLEEYRRSMIQKYLITDSSILTTIPECNPTGQPCIFRATLDNKIHSHTICSPNIIEKNWMPYVDHEGNHKVIYSLFPFVIKSIDNDDRQVLLIKTSLLEGYHGSTNGIVYEDGRLFLIHINNEKTYHRWMLFNPSQQTIKLSEPFVFF
jgi:hypothetical protein